MISTSILLKFSTSRTILIAMALMSVSALAQTDPDRSRAIASLTATDIAARSTVGVSREDRSPAASIDVYRIGVNDVIRIDIRDIPGVTKTLNVLPDGTIDLPLAGENIVVAGKTPAEAELLISGSIKLMSNARVRVRVSEFLSHTVAVWGLVDQPGEQQIQRDAVPFYVIRAATGIDARADRVRITHVISAMTDEYLLSDPKLDAIVVFPGDSIEFTNGRDSGN
jgi:protein involved in polysaccharide export with SLBB domain